jgi:Uma2 family endonuclease
MATAEALLTAEEYRLLPDDGPPTELVRGRIVPVNMPAPRHGEICANVVLLVGGYARAQGLGRVSCNDSGVVTERGPDTVRGADVAYYSYTRVPRGPLPAGYLPVAPDLVFEVRSPGDRWRDILAKVVEYLDAGVTAVCVLDPGPQRAHVYYADEPEQIFSADEELVLPTILGDFRLVVRRFFEEGQ